MIETELKDIVFNLADHKSPGLDGITAEIIKKSFLVVMPFLLNLCNESLCLGVFPSCLKKPELFPCTKKDLNPV